MQTDRKRELLEAYSRTKDQAIRNDLAEEYLYLAQAVARRFTGRGVDLEDLVQVASIALLHAIERFDYDKGLAFTTFAMPTLTGEVRNYLRDKSRLVRLPRRGSELLPRIARTREAFWQEHAREPSVTEIASLLGLSPDDVIDAMEMQRTTQAMSLDMTPTEDGPTLESLLGQDEEAYELIEVSDQIATMLAQLEGTSRFVIEERYLKQRSQREVAKDLGVSQMQVSRLERRALEHLRGRNM